MLTIKILGSGYPNYKKVEAIAKQAGEGLDVKAAFVKVTDYADIIAYNVLATPGLVINEKVVSAGRLPIPADGTTWLTNAMSIAE
ncbi:MAG: thioredoxin family protein [Anaerolineales bacterium]